MKSLNKVMKLFIFDSSKFINIMAKIPIVSFHLHHLSLFFINLSLRVP